MSVPYTMLTMVFALMPLTEDVSLLVQFMIVTNVVDG